MYDEGQRQEYFWGIKRISKNNTMYAQYGISAAWKSLTIDLDDRRRGWQIHGVFVEFGSLSFKSQSMKALEKGDGTQEV